MKRQASWSSRVLVAGFLWLLGVVADPQAAFAAPAGLLWHADIAGAGQSSTSSDAVVAPDACPGCCSSHGGISGQCASNGNIRCNDGTASPSCSCASCGVSQTPTCTGGRYWNGTSCVCPNGQVFSNGACRAPPTCTGGQTWNGTSCVCPSGQVLTNGVCATPPPTCTGGRTWNGTACACPAGQQFTNGQCAVVPPAFVIAPGISGNWYNPAQNGHGFQFEVIQGAPNVVTVFWFTFDNAGNQVWISGAGIIDGARLVVQALRQMGGRFPPNFNSAALTQLAWGTLTFTFSDCKHARVDWTSLDPAFSASGSLPIEQLTQVAGTTCP